MMSDFASFMVPAESTLQVELSEAPAILEQLIDAAIAGDDIVIAEHGTPLVRVIPYESGNGENSR
ncbi:MAG: type II toxin-antitoxin system Phd/YefM family antitoxin [Nitrospira sp.]